MFFTCAYDKSSRSTQRDRVIGCLPYNPKPVIKLPNTLRTEALRAKALRTMVPQCRREVRDEERCSFCRYGAAEKKRNSSNSLPVRVCSGASEATVRRGPAH